MTRSAPRALFQRVLPYIVVPFSAFAWSSASAQCNSGVTVTGTLTISADCSGYGVKPLTLNTGAQVTVNSGVTIDNDAGSGRNGDPVSVLSSSTGATLVNHGTLYTGSQWGVTVNGILTSLVNTGTIESGFRRAVVVNGGGTLGTLTNTGTISGPFADVTNSGTLQTLNNRQGAGNSAGALTIAGALPLTYNIIIDSPTSYGQLQNLGASGTTAFGIYGTSTVAAGTYSGVLVDFSSASLTGPLTGVYSGYTWQLALASGSTTLWNLVFSNALSAMIAGTPYTLADIGVTATPAFSGGTLRLNAGDTSNQAFTLDSAGGTLTSPAGGAASLSGVFSGAGGLTINGSGLLALSGANTYQGGTTVASGTLDVSGASPLGTGPVFVAAGGTLRGTGELQGPVRVAGTLKPGHSPGFLSVAGTVTMLGGSTYQQDIAGPVQATASSPAGSTGIYSFLDIKGGQFVIQPNATLAPRLAGLFTNAEPGFGSPIYTPVLGDRLRIVRADGGITGRFATLVQPGELAAGTQFLALYNSDDGKALDLAVIPSSYAATIGASGGNANARSAAGALDRVVAASQANTSTVLQDTLLLATSSQTAASLPAFTRGLAGEVYGATLATVPQASLRMQQSVNTHPTTESGAWGDLSYQRARRSNDSNASSFTANLSQLVMGVDGYAKDGIKAGGGFALSGTDVSAEQGSGQVQHGAVFAYGSMPQGVWTLDTLASLGVFTSKQTRADVTGATPGLASRSHGNDLLLSAGARLPLAVDGMRMAPYARLTWQQVRQSAFNEGVSASALSVSRYNEGGLRAVVGVSAGSSADSTLAQTWSVDLGLGADSSKLVSPTLGASLAGVPTSIYTPDVGTAFVQVGVSGTHRFTPNALAYADVSAEVRRGAVQSSVRVGLRVLF